MKQLINALIFIDTSFCFTFLIKKIQNAHLIIYKDWSFGKLNNMSRSVDKDWFTEKVGNAFSILLKDSTLKVGETVKVGETLKPYEFDIFTLISFGSFVLFFIAKS